MLLTKRLQETAYDLALAGLAGFGTGSIVSIYFMDGWNFETVGFCGLAFATYSTIDKWARLHPRKKINSVHSKNTSTARRIPISGGQSWLFMNAIKMPGQSQPETVIDREPQEYIATYQGLDYTVTRGELENFLYTAWKRQRNNKAGLSRTYWTKTQRLQRELYEARILILDSSGLIVDRGERRSGRLTVPPQMAIKTINQSIF